jgi:hypothetical protein
MTGACTIAMQIFVAAAKDHIAGASQHWGRIVHDNAPTPA